MKAYLSDRCRFTRARRRAVSYLAQLGNISQMVKDTKLFSKKAGFGMPSDMLAMASAPANKLQEINDSTIDSDKLMTWESLPFCMKKYYVWTCSGVFVITVTVHDKPTGSDSNDLMHFRVIL